MSLFPSEKRTHGVCTECGNEADLWIVTDEDWLCEECLDFLDYTQCAICGEFYPEDQVEFTELPDGREVCEYCMEDYENT